MNELGTWYLSLTPINEPRDLQQLDEAQRAQIVFEVLALKRPSATFVEELLQVLEEANVGQEKENLFGTSLADIPTTGGPFLSIVTIAGAEPIGTHTAAAGKPSGMGAYRRPAARILVRSPKASDAEAMAQAAYQAFVDCRNRFVLPKVR